jgi:hypothetical protein
LKVDPGLQLALGVVERLPGDVHRRGKPVCQRQARHQRERAMGGAEPLLAPAAVREAEVMTPVVRLEGDGAPRSRCGVETLPGALQHEPERGPRLAGPRIETARLARVAHRRLQRDRVRNGVGSRHLELQRTRIGEPDVRSRLLGDAAQHLVERRTRAIDAVALQRLERRPPLDPGTVRRQQRVERDIARPRHRPRHRGGEPVPLPRHRLNARLPIRRVADDAAQGGHRLLEAVVGHRHVAPRRVDERVLRQHAAGVRDQVEKHAEMAIGDRHRRAGARQPASLRVELERAKRVDGRHAGILAWGGGGFGMVMCDLGFVKRL